jgi:hypothetical protein
MTDEQLRRVVGLILVKMTAEGSWEYGYRYAKSALQTLESLLEEPEDTDELP